MELILTISGAAIVLLLGIIGFFIVRYFKIQDNTNEKLEGTVDKLNNSVSGLNAILLVMQEHQDNVEKSCIERHIQLNKQIEKISI